MGDHIVVLRGRRVKKYAKLARVLQGRDKVEVWWYYPHRFCLPGRLNELYLSDHGGVVELRDISTTLQYLSILTTKSYSGQGSIGSLGAAGLCFLEHRGMYSELWLKKSAIDRG